MGEIIGYRKPLNKIANPREGLDSIYLYGSNNLYPYYVQNSILGSPTGAMAHRLHSRFISGRLGIEDILINKRRDLWLSSLKDIAGSDVSMFSAYYIHVNYGYDVDTETFYPKDPTILPFENCRISKEDDHGFYSKVFVEDFLNDTSRFKASKAKWYYRYDPTPSVIKAQILNDAKENDIDTSTPEGIEEALRSYRGQVRFCNLTAEFPYPTSIADAALMDMCSEYFISEYTYGQTGNGFMGKTVAFLKEGTSEEDILAQSQMLDWLGTANSSGIYGQAVKHTDDIDKILSIKTFPSQFDDKLFQVTTERIQSNILGAFDNAPKILIQSGDGALFGTNPETWDNAEKLYSKNTEYARKFLERTLSDTLKINIPILPLIDAT